MVKERRKFFGKMENNLARLELDKMQKATS